MTTLSVTTSAFHPEHDSRGHCIHQEEHPESLYSRHKRNLCLLGRGLCFLRMLWALRSAACALGSGHSKALHALPSNDSLLAKRQIALHLLALPLRKCLVKHEFVCTQAVSQAGCIQYCFLCGAAAVRPDNTAGLANERQLVADDTARQDHVTDSSHAHTSHTARDKLCQWRRQSPCSC